MIVFALSCFGLVIFLWLSFGGPIPLKPQQYRLTVAVPEASTLANEADVRMSGITIGKVKSKELDKADVATKVTLDIQPRFAPIPKASVEPTVELDEIFSAFDKPTREAFRAWVAESAKAIKGKKGNPDSTAESLNNAFGNLGPFADNGADVLGVLDRQKTDLGKLIRNTGEVFGAISERDHALQHLITNSDQVFTATNSRDAALREIFRIFPTFLDESKATMTRLKTFSINTRPLVRDLRPVAAKLDPTVKDLAGLSPDLRQLFRDLDPLITVSNKNLPAAAAFLRGAAPVLEGLHSFLQEFNPVLSYLNYDARALTGFLSDGAAATNYRFKTNDGNIVHALSQYGVINARSFAFGNSPPGESEGSKMPDIERANAYPLPENYLNSGKYGIIQSFSCAHIGGNKDSVSDKSPPCHEQGKSAWDGNLFPRLERGKAPNQKAPDDPAPSEMGQPKQYK